MLYHIVCVRGTWCAASVCSVTYILVTGFNMQNTSEDAYSTGTHVFNTYTGV